MARSEVPEGCVRVDDHAEAGARGLDQCDAKTLEFRRRDEKRSGAQRLPEAGIGDAEMKIDMARKAEPLDLGQEALSRPVRGRADD